MKAFLLTLSLMLFVCTFSYGQTSQDFEDPKYREDQFYAGFSYGLLTKLPEASKSRGLSGSLQIGYLRDMPVNANRNLAIALGVGLNFNRFGQNLFVGKDDDGNTFYRILGKEGPVKYKANRLGVTVLEAPLEFRWRSSTTSSYQFWRVYAGFRLGYVIHSSSVFKQENNVVKVTQIEDIEKLRYSATLSFGYNKINFFAKYDLNNLFKKDTFTTDASTIEIVPIEFGFIFYLL